MYACTMYYHVLPEVGIPVESVTVPICTNLYISDVDHGNSKGGNCVAGRGRGEPPCVAQLSRIWVPWWSKDDVEPTLTLILAEAS